MTLLHEQRIAHLVVQLAKTGDQRVQEILIAALTDYGRDEPQKMERILTLVFKHHVRYRLSAGRHKVKTAQCPTWKRVALMVASGIGTQKVILLGLTDSTPSVRAVALQNAFIYSRNDQEMVFELIDYLLKKSFGFLSIPFLPVPRNFESLIGLSFLVLFRDFEDIATMTRLRAIWKVAIEKILWFNPARSWNVWKRIKDALRSKLLSSAVSFMVDLFSSSNMHTFANEFKLFFKHDSDHARRKEVVRTLAPYLDVESTNLHDIRDVLLSLAYEHDMFIVEFTYTLFQRHVLVHPDVVLPILRQLFYQAIQVTPPDVPGPFSSRVPNYSLFLQGFVSDESRHLYLDLMKERLDRFQGKWKSKLRVLRNSYLDIVNLADTNASGDATVAPLVRNSIERMIETRDYNWMKHVIHLDITFRAVQHGWIRFAFSFLEIVMETNDQEFLEDKRMDEVTREIIELLAKMRVYYPNEVDHFLDTVNVSMDFKREVSIRASSESIGDIIGSNIHLFITKTFILDGSVDLWKKIIWLFEQAAESNSFEQWLTILSKLAINEIYGDKVFTDIPV